MISLVRLFFITTLAGVADAELHLNARRGCGDLKTMASYRHSGFSQGFRLSRPHDTSRQMRMMSTKGWVFKERRGKACLVASLSINDASKETDCSQFLSSTASWLNIEGTEKVGVLLLNLGGPETLDDVQPFLYNLFADPDIIRLPRLLKVFQQPLAKFISLVRAPKSKEGYAAIGGGSPLRRITEDQANALKEALLAKNVSAKVYIGMRYWHPFTEEALEQLKRDQITRLVILPLYPQFSISTSGSSLRVLEEIFRKDQYFANLQHTVIPSWYQREGYVQAMADLVGKELKTFKKTNEVVVFFSAHGVPRTYVEEAGDPYKEEMEECVRLVMAELKKRGVNNKYVLAYQSRVGPVEWLKPYTDDTIKELGKMGVKGLLTVPISFVSEHIETLEEIDMEYRELAYVSGIEEWGRVPALGCKSSFINDLADAVIEELQKFKANDAPTKNPVWTISRTLQDYFLPYGGRAWMEWISGGH
ncbi:hypothetical protein L7F22_031344 [Adiantum nelumboides]|nr:hypothetical protein [Adiantum nelumboides]